MKARLVELKKVGNLGEFTVMDVAPGPGIVGLIMANILMESLKSEKIAEVHSPYFPQISVVNNDGIASIPKVELYLLEAKDGKKVVLVSRNFLINGEGGGIEVASLLFDYLRSLGGGQLVIVSSGRVTGTGEVYAVSNTLELSRTLAKFGAKVAPSMDSLPIDKLASLLLLRYMMESRPTYLIISDTSSYVPDLAQVKKTLSVLTGFLGIEVDTAKLDQEIRRQQELMEEFIKSMGEEGKGEEGTPSYIG